MNAITHCRLTIALPEISPPVWRELVLPTDIPLDRLHDVIQIAMGWQDCHLYEFVFGHRRVVEHPEDGDGEGAGKVRLGEVLAEANGVFSYLYDFGDSWQHLIKAAAPEIEAEDLFSPVICVDGKRACPPENVGGPPGYEEFCEAVKNRKHPDHDDMTQWYAEISGSGRKFKPEEFDVAEVNRQLCQYLRWTRPRALEWKF